MHPDFQTYHWYLFCRNPTKGHLKVMRPTSKSPTPTKAQASSHGSGSDNLNLLGNIYLSLAGKQCSTDASLISSRAQLPVGSGTSAKGSKNSQSSEGKARRASVLGLLRRRSTSELPLMAHVDPLGVLASTKSVSNVKTVAKQPMGGGSGGKASPSILQNSFNAYSKLLRTPKLVNGVTSKSAKGLKELHQGSRCSPGECKVNNTLYLLPIVIAQMQQRWKKIFGTLTLREKYQTELV